MLEPPYYVTWSIWIVDLTNGQKRTKLGPGLYPEWSPDGDWLGGFSFTGAAYTSAQSTAILLYSLETQKYRKVTDFGMAPRWLSDGRRLSFAHQNAIYLADIETGEVRKLFSHPRDQFFYPTVSADGQWMYFMRQETDSDIWMLTLNEEQ